MNRYGLTLNPKGPFSLEPLKNLACGFLRGSRCSTGDTVDVAFPADFGFETVGASLRRAGDVVRVEVVSNAASEVVRSQLERALCFDHDGEAFASTLASDPALAPIIARRPGFRPVVAYSPYVMAGWCVLTQRLSMDQAARLQIAMAERFGDVVEVNGARLASFPHPAHILAEAGFPGISAEKWSRLQTVAAAALGGELDADGLLALPHDEARARLQKLRGIGPWSAEGILVRGCGTTDALPLGEPMLHVAIAEAYGLSQPPTDAEVIAIAERWRPFRTWVSVLLISTFFRRIPAQRGARSRSKIKPASALAAPVR